MREPKMNLMEDGWHYKDLSVIYVERGKVIEYLYHTYSQGVVGFRLVNPIPAWNSKDTWHSIASSRVVQIDEKQLNLDLAEMPHRCRTRLLENKKYG